MSSRIEKKDLKKVFFRHLSIGSMNDYQGVLHHGYTYSMLPIIDKVYDDKEDRIKAKKRHMDEYFAITPNVSGFTLGVTAAMEEENANNPNFDEKTISTVSPIVIGVPTFTV